MTSLIQVVLLAGFAVPVARCFALPSSYDPTPLLLTPHPDPQQLSAGPLSHTNEEDEKASAIGREASVFDHSADAVPEKKPIEGLTKLKSGYSKVVSSQSAAVGTHATKHEAANRIQARQPAIADSAKSSENAKESHVVVGLGGHDVEDDDEEEAYDIFAAEEIGSTPTANKSNMSAKDSLAIFMREHLYAASQSAPTSYGGQSMAAKLTIEDDRATAAATDEDDGKAKPGAEGSSSYAPLREEMERRLSDFVQKFMSGVLKAEVRVEERANGLQDYTAA